MPKAIRTDNGAPFGVPSRDVVPIMSLWLIAWNIKPILNRPKRPTDNPNVENNQHTSARWAEVYKSSSIKQMEERLDQAATIQRDLFEVTRLGNVTRKQLFRNLYDNSRTFDKAYFDINKAYNFLAKAIYPRKISSKGTIVIYSKVVSVGLPFKGQIVFLNFSPKDIAWLVLDQNKNIIKAIPDPRFSEQNLYNLNLCQ